MRFSACRADHKGFGGFIQAPSPLREMVGARASIRCKISVRTRIQAGVSVMRGLGVGVRARWWLLQLLDGHSPRSLPSLALHGLYEHK